MSALIIVVSLIAFVLVFSPLIVAGQADDMDVADLQQEGRNE